MNAAFGRVVAAMALLGALAVSSAHAGLFDDDEARKAILDLRQRIEALRQSTATAQQKTDTDLQRLAEENVQLRRSLLDLQNQIEQLRQEQARMRGQDETLARDLADVQRRQKDLATGVEDRLRRFEPVKVSLDGREFQAEPGEKRDFDAALATFRKGDFPAAQVQFVELLRRFPASGYLPSALFWLGNAQYATRDYKEAIANFRAVLAQSPDFVRAPEAALSIANCQIELKDSKSARKTLDDLIKAYPQSEAAAAARERLARLK